MKKILCVALLLLSLVGSGCGPILGKMMSAGDGLKSLDVVSGQVPVLKPGTMILVYGPFEKTDAAFYVCRGEDAAKFADEFTRLGLRGELYLGHGSRAKVTLAAAKLMTPEELRVALSLPAAPDYLFSGTLTQRKMNVAPAHGVIMDEGYRLELIDLRTQARSEYQARVKDLAQETIPDVAEALVAKLGLGAKK